VSETIKLLRIAATPDSRFGGVSRAIHFTSDFLQQRGFEIRHLLLDSFRWRVSPGLKRFTNPWEAKFRIQQAIKEWNGCDIVEVHEPLTFGCCLFRSQLKKPQIVGFSHGLEERARNAEVSYRKQKSLNFPLKGKITSYIQALTSTSGLLRCSHVVTLNSEDTKFLVGRGMSPNRISSHFNGVSQTLIQQGALASLDRPCNLLFVGTWIERKGILEIVSAVSAILQQRESCNFTIAGCGCPASEILSFFPEAIHSRINIIPKVSTDLDLASLYQSHRILLLPSNFEGFPLVMIEAAAFGLAIVTTPICGMRDFVHHHDNGIHVPVGSSPDLATETLRLIDHPTLAMALGASARQSAASYSWSASADNLASIYRKVFLHRQT
jgi:glycosyltransferase involved in cell wall biosynthesis